MKETKMQVSIEIDCEQISDLVFNELQDTLSYFEEDMEKDNPAVFSNNEIYDKILIQNHIDAIKLLLEWYRVP